MTKEVAEKIVRGITDKIECNTVDIDDWAEFWGFTREEYEDFLDMAIKALEQELCPDVISRSDMLDAIGHGTTYTSQELKGIVKALPPVNPQPKTGKWIYKKDLKQFFCNKCEYPSLTDDDKYIYSMDLPNFCENCGAKMVELQESEDKE